MRAKDAMPGVELGARLAVAGQPCALVRLGPGSGRAHSPAVPGERRPAGPDGRLARPAVVGDRASVLVADGSNLDLVVGRALLVGSADLVSAPERADWDALEANLGVVGEPTCELGPVAA